MNAVTTPCDVETYIIACLGDLRSDYDVAVIVAAIRTTDWWPVPDRPVTILDDLPDISAIFERHDLRPGARAP